MMRSSYFLATLLALFALIFSAGEQECKFNPQVEALLNVGSQERWVNWIAELSGAVSVTTKTGEGRITTRYSFTLFNGTDGLNAFDYLLETLEGMGFEEGSDFIIHRYAFPFEDRYPDRNWKNVILTFPGTDPRLKDERVILMAHLDSVSPRPGNLAPGADDNASGAAGLLEAAFRFRRFEFGRTVHLIWFTGEEQARQGSKHFLEDYQDWLADIVGVINLDMFAFDWDNDRCFEIHAGVLPESQQIGRCMEDIINAYALDLTHDFIDDERAYTLSDHGPFWDLGVPGIMIFENFFYHGESGCGTTDRNNHYHNISDTLTYINQETGYAILQASIATLGHIAEVRAPCFINAPKLTGVKDEENILLSWNALEGTKEYQVWKEQEQGWGMLEKTTGTSWSDLLGNDPTDHRHPAGLLYPVPAVNP